MRTILAKCRSVRYLDGMDNLYENTNTGRVCCEKHIGHEATIAFRNTPKARSVKTSFGTIRRMTETDRIEWIEMVKTMWASGCESCK